jgi:hypothetical protein
MSMKKLLSVATLAMLASPALAGDYYQVGDKYYPEGGGVLGVAKTKEKGDVMDSMVCLSDSGKPPCKWHRVGDLKGGWLHDGVRADELPSTMLGSWCGSWGYNFPDAPENVGYPWWAKDVEECANRGGVRFGKHNYQYHRFGLLATCIYTHVDLLSDKGLREEDIKPQNGSGGIATDLVRPMPPSGVYLINASCHGHGTFEGDEANKDWNESYKVQAVHGWLIRQGKEPE